MKQVQYTAPCMEVTPVEAESLLAASLAGTNQSDVNTDNNASDDEGRVKGYNPFGSTPF